jgi:hypothetical protein
MPAVTSAGRRRIRPRRCPVQTATGRPDPARSTRLATTRTCRAASTRQVLAFRRAWQRPSRRSSPGRADRLPGPASLDTPAHPDRLVTQVTQISTATPPLTASTRVTRLDRPPGRRDTGLPAISQGQEAPGRFRARLALSASPGAGYRHITARVGPRVRRPGSGRPGRMRPGMPGAVPAPHQTTIAPAGSRLAATRPADRGRATTTTATGQVNRRGSPGDPRPAGVLAPDAEPGRSQHLPGARDRPASHRAASGMAGPVTRPRSPAAIARDAGSQVRTASFLA